jgi:hypothetical protein
MRTSGYDEKVSHCHHQAVSLREWDHPLVAPWWRARWHRSWQEYFQGWHRMYRKQTNSLEFLIWCTDWPSRHARYFARP